LLDKDDVMQMSENTLNAIIQNFKHEAPLSSQELNHLYQLYNGTIRNIFF